MFTAILRAASRVRSGYRRTVPVGGDNFGALLSRHGDNFTKASCHFKTQ
jgi:hypothetical protein